MIKLNAFILIILLSLLSSLLSGCGQKGALRQADKKSLEIDQAYEKQAAQRVENLNPKSPKPELSIEKEAKPWK